MESALLSGRTPSYYVQQMFSLNRGDVVLSNSVVAPATAGTNHGAIGLGTWNTQSAYYNLVVTAGSTLLYQSDFTTPSGITGWQLGTGTWVESNGWFEQTAGGTDNTATYGSTTWSNYTYTLRAMKLGGSVLVRGCEFQKNKPQVDLGAEVRRAVISDNLIRGRLRIANHSSLKFQIHDNAADTPDAAQP